VNRAETKTIKDKEGEEKEPVVERGFKSMWRNLCLFFLM
jgi:hypothetical protein